MQIPLLTIIILAMLYNRVPKAWTGVAEYLDAFRSRNVQAEPRVVEIA